MKNKKFLLWVFVVLAFAVTSCNGNELPNDGRGMGKTLFNTNWELVGIFDIEKNMLLEREPQDCKECYILDFWPDTTVFDPGYAKEFRVAFGKLITIPFTALYIVDYTRSTINFSTIERPAIDEDCDAESCNAREYAREYESILITTQAFELTDKELRLYCGNKKKYLLFKRKER